MEAHLSAVLSALESFPVWILLICFFFSALLENVFPPHPGDTIIVFAGFVAARQPDQLWPIFLSGVFGSVAGAFIMYSLGDRFLDLCRRLVHVVHRPRFLNRLLEGFVSTESIEKTSFWFRKYGLGFVVFSRFSAGIRFFVSIIAGISHVRPIPFLSAFSVGVLIWNGLLTAGGYYLGQNWERVLEWLKVYNTIVIVLISVGVLAYVAFRLHRARSVVNNP
ncbi:MAG: DedA family protein [Leptospirales bacterium]|nr:DedA family protein [Leptospirales bacterium]